MIRHGESEANRDGYFSGNLDVKLTNKGIAQAEMARKVIENFNVPPVTIVHSHLSRAKDTAVIINQNIQLPIFETKLIEEHKFGNWEKQPWDKIKPKFEAGEDPPNGETHEAFKKRILKGINWSLQKEGPILIVCHGGVFKGFCSLYNQEMHGIKNCGLYRFTPTNDITFPWKINLIE